jgi:hypothetical protein
VLKSSTATRTPGSRSATRRAEAWYSSATATETSAPSVISRHSRAGASPASSRAPDTRATTASDATNLPVGERDDGLVVDLHGSRREPARDLLALPEALGSRPRELAIGDDELFAARAAPEREERIPKNLVGRVPPVSSGCQRASRENRRNLGRPTETCAAERPPARVRGRSEPGVERPGRATGRLSAPFLGRAGGGPAVGRALVGGAGRDRTCDQGIMSPLL